MARITVQYLADQLGLSKFAVSRALAGKAGVSEATRQLVVETAQHFGYVPKPKFKKRANAIEIGLTAPKATTAPTSTAETRTPTG